MASKYFAPLDTSNGRRHALQHQKFFCYIVIQNHPFAIILPAGLLRDI